MKDNLMIEVKTIKELCMVVADCPHSTPKWTSSGKIVIRSNNIKNGKINFSSPSYTDEKNFEIRTKRAMPRGGDLIIPSFAVGRAQELLYFIREIKEKNMIRNHPNFKVYLDSPLANEATEIYDKRVLSYCNSETAALIEQGINPIIFNGLVRTTSVLDSKAISANENPKIIISAAGMCDAGRIRHHLKHNLWRSECTIMFVGYQAVGTLGRIILDGATKVKIFGEEIKVSAEIIQFPGISAYTITSSA